MIELDKWEKVYTVMRVMDVCQHRATKIANIATGECREQPDDKALARKSLEFINQCKQNSCDPGFILKASSKDKPKPNGLAANPNQRN